MHYQAGKRMKWGQMYLVWFWCVLSVGQCHSTEPREGRSRLAEKSELHILMKKFPILKMLQLIKKTHTAWIWPISNEFYFP
jgi:hypothetical protein